MTKAKPIYDAAITYYTPAGRKVRYSNLVAANTLAECEELLRGRLDNEVRFGRRKVARVAGEFSATFVTLQIGGE